MLAVNEGIKRLYSERLSMAWVYILRCRDGSYYTGSTTDLERRIAEHQRGMFCSYTSVRRPVELVFCERTKRLDEAFLFERQIKGWSRKKKEALIAGRYDLLPTLARSNEVAE